MRKIASEATIQAQVCKYLKVQYPTLIFTSEASGLKLTIGQAKKMKDLRSSSGLPDLWVMEPKGKYKGLFLELKAKTIYKKDGSYLTDDHIQEQLQVLGRLRMKGYHAEFVVGFEQAKEEIDWYMAIS